MPLCRDTCWAARATFAPGDKTTVAGIGTGGQGTQNMLRLQEFPEIQVVAVCDVNREGGGYLSWTWGAGKELRLAGREPVRRALEDYYAPERAPASTRRSRPTPIIGSC